jgi:hypothetical protein
MLVFITTSSSAFEVCGQAGDHMSALRCVSCACAGVILSVAYHPMFSPFVSRYKCQFGFLVLRIHVLSFLFVLREHNLNTHFVIWCRQNVNVVSCIWFNMG